MPKLSLVIHNDPMDRLTVNLHESVMKRLELYKEYNEEMLGGKLQQNYIVEEMLKTVMNEDKDFKAFLKVREDAQAAAPVSAASKSVPVNREEAARSSTNAAAAPVAGNASSDLS
jgi:hypothetical protein